MAEEDSEELVDWLTNVALESGPEQKKYIADWYLEPVVARLPIPRYLNEIWKRRNFIWEDAKSRAFGQSRSLILGHAWLILQPLLDIAVYGVIFGFLLKTSRGIENFVGYLAIGVIFFGFFTRALSSGVTLIPSSHNLIRAFSFPRAALITSFTIRNFLNSLPTVGATLLFVGIVYGSASVTWTWLLLVPITVFQVIYCAGLTCFAARIGHVVPDMSVVINLFTRFWFYGSGVFFSIDNFKNVPIVQTIMRINPAYQFLEVYRDMILYGRPGNWYSWLYIGLFSTATLLVGFVYFWWKEVDYGRER